MPGLALLPLLLAVAAPRPFTRPPKALLAEAGKGGTEVVIEDHRLEFAGDGTEKTQRYEIIRIGDSQAVERWGTVELYWQPWREARPTIKARVVTADGKAHWLDPKTIATAPASSGDELTDSQVVKAPMPALQPGSVLELLIEHPRSRPEFPGSES